MTLPGSKHDARQPHPASQGRTASGVRREMRRAVFVVGAESALLLAGFVALSYCAGSLLAAKHYQADAQRRFRVSASELAPTGAAYSGSDRPARTVIPPAAAAPVGRLQIPAVGLSAMIAEGDTPGVLRVAVGHVPGTALPGQPGNVVLAAHRDAFFRRLGELKTGDVVRISTLGSDHNYQVTFTDVVSPQETWVMRPATGDTLTLITCYPFHFIGPAPKRFVVRARQMSISNR